MLENVLDRITKTTKKGPWKVAKNMWKRVPLLNVQQHETLGKEVKKK